MREACTCTMYVLYTPLISVAGSDYTPPSTPLTISAGTTNQTVTIMASTDNVVEDPETFTLSVTSTDPAVTGMAPSATVTIEDDNSK